MNRDSKYWWVGMGGAFAAALAIHPDLIEGLLELDKKAIASVICLLLAIAAGKMATSPLPGEHDDNTVRRY